MTIIRLIYLAVVVIAGLFVVLYIDSLSLLLLLVTLALPLILFLLLLLARVLTKITVEPPSSLATKGQAVSLKFHIRNRSFVALPSVRVKVTYNGAFSNEPEFTEITFPLHALTKQTAFCDITSEHVGVVKVKVEDILLHDYFRLFTLKIKVREEYEITFLPEILPVSMEIRPNTLLGDDSDVFSKTKKGDDPSEVFDIRDYVGGDKLNRIHWKLSSKQDNLMVKDYSLPLNNDIVILAELSSKKGDDKLTDIDTVVETVMCVSNFLCEAEIAHHISWYDCKGERFFNEEIKTVDDMFTALGLMLASGIGEGCDSMTFWKKERHICSHVAYISAVQDDSVLQDLSELSYATFYSILRVGDGNEFGGDTSGAMQFLAVRNGKVLDALSGFAL